MVSVAIFASEQPEYTIPIENIRIRDPYIVSDRNTQTYYMYAQFANRNVDKRNGVEVYTSKDLKKWSEPRPVLVLPKEMDIVNVWAPEVHFYQGSWYMFVTLTFDEMVATPSPASPEIKSWPPMYRRGTWIFRADSPLGPFKMHSSDSVTPREWMALDGTLWIEDGKPYMIFCHEWVQVVDGTIDYIPLANDLSKPSGKAVKMFAASSSPDVKEARGKVKITDGPFLYRSPQHGDLYMIWSTRVKQTPYGVLLTRSESGKLAGPWTVSKLLFIEHGGHGMFFNTLDGKMMMAIHRPNTRGKERLQLVELVDDGKTLKIKQ
ncbi:MAG: glycoside hydrolase family 43 protein [Planctomycetia bacterium]|nr:glycoside hydrolase family 43 protein [Planctomycetia bacterium]